LSEEQREEAHQAHLLELDSKRSTMPKMAFCDIGHKDKTHHTNVYCKVMEKNRAVGHVYAPKTNQRVLLGLYPTQCEECAIAK
jgi:hypothetical protein